MIGQKGYPPIHGGIEKHVAEIASRLGGDDFRIDIYSRPHYSRRSGAADLPGVWIAATLEIPYANVRGRPVTPDSARAFGRDLARAVQAYLEGRGGE